MGGTPIRIVVFAVACVIPAIGTAQRQPGVLAGRVLADSSRHPIAHASISVPALSLRATSDSAGAFRFAGVPPGLHRIEVRRIGFVPYTELVKVAETETSNHEFLLVRIVELQSIDVTASGTIASFEEHRSIGLGRFLTRQELEKQEGRRLSEVIAQFPGVRIIAGGSGQAWLASRRGVASLNPRTCGTASKSPSLGLDENDARRGAKQCECYALVYLDKALLYRGSQVGGEPLTDLNSFPVDQIEAIEYYSGPSNTPLEYRRLNSNCGAIVIHTRR